MVNEHAQPAAGTGREACHDAHQIVCATKVLDDDALDAQIFSPDLCDQFGVMTALDIDPASPGDPGTDAWHRDRTGCRLARGRGRRAARRGEDRWAPSVSLRTTTPAET